MYVIKTTKISDEISLVQKHGPGKHGAPGQKRKKKEKETPEAVKVNNRKERAQKIQLAILANFQDGHHIVLGYPKGGAPETYEEAEHYLLGFLDGIRRELKPLGYQFRYIAATERGKRTAVLHHHILIQDIEEPDCNLLKLIEDRWIGKRVHSTPTYEDDTMGRQLADYIVKSIDKDGEPKGKYHISRNLKKPEVTRELHMGHMDEPEAPVGFQIVQDTLYKGINPYTGWQYQRYFIRSIKNGCFSEWNRESRHRDIDETATGKAKGLFSKLKNLVFRNGIGICEGVDNREARTGAEKLASGKEEKPSVQNGNAAFQTVDKTKQQYKPFCGHAKNVFRNGNKVYKAVDNIKTALGLKKKYIDMTQKPADRNRNGGLHGSRDSYSDHDTPSQV